MKTHPVRIELTRAEFEQFRTLLEREGGLAMDPARQGLLQAGVAARMEAHALASIADYFRLLFSASGGRAEVRALLQSVTVGETQFFRYPAQFDALTRHLVPALVQARGRERRLAVWSAGCATGEEVYSIVVALLEALPQPATWALTVLATDLHRGSVARAQGGWYPARALRGVPPAWREKYFLPEAEGYRVREAVRRLVRVVPHNLVRDPFTLPEMREVDLLWCRNVTMYMTPDTTKQLIGQFAGAICDGGYLFLGHAETLWGVSNEFTPVVFPEAVVYQKTAARPSGSARSDLAPPRQAFRSHPNGGDFTGTGGVPAAGAAAPVPSARREAPAPPQRPQDPSVQCSLASRLSAASPN